MDARTYIESYAKEHHKDEHWLDDKVMNKIASVGGLITDEGAIMLIAEEHGWVMEEKAFEPPKERIQEMPITQYTELSDAMLDLIWGTSKGGEKTRYPDEPLVVKIERIYDAKKPENDYSSMETSAKVTDGRNLAYFNFQDKPEFSKGEKTFPANYMSSAVQQVRPQLIGKTIAIYKWQLYKGVGKDGFDKFYMGSTNFTYFKPVDTSWFENGLTESDIIDEMYDEVPVDELLEEEEGV